MTKGEEFLGIFMNLPQIFRQNKVVTHKHQLNLSSRKMHKWQNIASHCSAYHQKLIVDIAHNTALREHQVAKFDPKRTLVACAKIPFLVQ